MTLDEKREHLLKIEIKYAIVGYLKNTNKLEGCLCVSEEDLKNELMKFEIVKKFEIKK